MPWLFLFPLSRPQGWASEGGEKRTRTEARRAPLNLKKLKELKVLDDGG